MQQFFDTVGAIDGEGDVIVLVGASVTVYDAGTTNVASIYSDDGVTVKDNPFLSGEEGQISFYAADGRYDIYVHLSPYKPVKILDILLEDPTTSSSGEMSTHLSTFTHSDISVNKSSITSLGVVDSQNKSLSDSADISLATRDSQNTSIITSASLSLTTKDSQNLSVAISADLSAITRLSGVDSTLSSACDSNIVRFSSSNSALSSSDNSIVTKLSTADSTVLSIAMSAADSASSGGSDDSVAQSMATSVATQDSIATSQANSADLSITSRLSSADSIILSTASSNTDSADTSVVTRLSSIDSSVLSTAVSAADSVAAADSDDSVAQSMATSVATQESTTTSQALSANTSIISQLSTVDSSDSSIALSAAQSAANLASGGAVDDVARDNIVLNAWRIAIDGGLARFNLEDGVVDEFEDETGVDTTNSLNESYNSTDDYYSPVAGAVVDNMEYATDGAAQTAYVTNATYSADVITGGTASADNAALGAAANACDNGADYWLTGDVSYPHWWKYDYGAGVTKQIQRITLHEDATLGGWRMKDFVFQGSNDDSDWTTVYTGQHANNTNVQTFQFSNENSYRYYRLYFPGPNWNGANSYCGATEFEMMELPLQCYSESTIKTQGSYSLKGVAAITDSLNKTLTRTLSSPIDLTGQDTAYFDLRASRTGSNIKVGLRQRYLPNDSYVKLLVHCDGSDNGTTFTDEIGKTVSKRNSPVTKTGTKKFGTASVYSDGDDGLYVNDSADWDFGSGDFTIEAFLNFAALVSGTWYGIMGQYGATNGARSWVFYRYTDDKFYVNFFLGATQYEINWSSAGYSTGQWYHWAFVRYGNDFKCYIDGTQVGSTVTQAGSWVDGNEGFCIFGNRDSGGTWRCMNGYIDEIRISKGIARYTATFTPPTLAFNSTAVIETTPEISSADTFETKTWDLSSVADADKNNIDGIIITIVNADASNTFYIDAFASPLANMTLISEPSEAEAEPTNARLIILAEPVDSITINTDLKGYVSLDDGSNFEQVTLVDQGNFDTAKHIYAGSEDLTDRNDKTMVWKIETANSKSVKIHAIGLLWK